MLDFLAKLKFVFSKKMGPSGNTGPALWVFSPSYHRTVCMSVPNEETKDRHRGPWRKKLVFCGSENNSYLCLPSLCRYLLSFSSCSELKTAPEAGSLKQMKARPSPEIGGSAFLGAGKELERLSLFHSGISGLLRCSYSTQSSLRLWRSTGPSFSLADIEL